MARKRTGRFKSLEDEKLYAFLRRGAIRSFRYEGIAIGDKVKYSFHEGVVNKFKGKPAGEVFDILWRSGATEPTFVLRERDKSIHFALREHIEKM